MSNFLHWNLTTKKSPSAPPVIASRLFINLTPLIPLSFEGEGESIYRRGASTPLKHPIKLNSLSKENEGEIIERGFAPL